MASQRSRLLTLFLPLMTLYVVWGSTYLAIRIAIETLPPFLMASVRFLVAGALLYSLSIGRGDRAGDRPGRRQWVAALIVGGLLLAGGNGMVSWGEQFLSSGLAALLVATVPLWMVLLSHVFGQERLTPAVGVGVVVGLLGVAILANPGGTNDIRGVLAVLLAAILWACGSVYARVAPLPKRAFVATSLEMLAGSAVLAVLGVATGELGRVNLGHVSLASSLAVGYLVVFGSIAAFSSYVWLLKTTRPSIAGTYAYVNPAVAVVLGWLILGEPLTGRTIVGGAVINLAVALIVTAQSTGLTFRRRRPAVVTDRMPEEAA
jgi:drug/metabolite transporter (DMT)-like permease